MRFAEDFGNRLQLQHFYLSHSTTIRFNESDFENGYSRNLLWRLWHASKALEMEYLSGLCARTIHDTMCEETVFWDLNYAMQYRALGTGGEIMVKVLKVGQFTPWGVHSVVIFCRVFPTCSTGRWADTAAIVQPNW